MQLLEKRYNLDSILRNETVQLSLLYFLAFSIPFILKGPQLLVGSLINFLLLTGFSSFKYKKILPILFLPSLASYVYGVLFGSATNFLLYLIPFIAIANGIYVYIYKKFNNSSVAIVLASFLKAIFLFGCTYILFKTIGLPSVFLTSMGVIQFYTALIGGITAHMVISSKR